MQARGKGKRGGKNTVSVCLCGVQRQYSGLISHLEPQRLVQNSGTGFWVYKRTTHPAPHASISSCTFKAVHAQVPLAAPHIKCVPAGLIFNRVPSSLEPRWTAETRKSHRLTFSSFILIRNSYIVQII